MLHWFLIPHWYAKTEMICDGCYLYRLWYLTSLEPFWWLR